MSEACELCEEYEATHAGKTLCSTCNWRVWNYMRQGPKWIMQRRANLKLYLRTVAAVIGDDVSFMDDEIEKKSKAA